MASVPAASPLQRLTRQADLQIPVALILVVSILVIPLPAPLLDLLLSLNLGVSLVVLLLTTYTRNALEFSVFPSLLLVLTLFRLALNVAATKLILGEAHAGQVINAFGEMVVGGNQVVGIVVFAILVVIQFVVITSGAGRVAEVAARFTLDAMPGKQMAIDADLNAGIIDENQARIRRRQIQQEADFYGSMDGASKFVRGDAIAAIVIVLINIIGGFIIGMVQKGMPANTAFVTYTKLTVGEGLVTQIPALVVSVATGIIVTRAASDANLAVDISTQVTRYPTQVFVAAGAVMVFGVVLHTASMVFMGGGLAAIAYLMIRSQDREERVAVETRKEAAKPTGPEDVRPLLDVEPIELEIGYGLIPLALPAQGGDLLDRVTMIRKQTATELGLVVPPIRIRDNMQLDPNSYTTKLRGVQVATGQVMVDRYLAIGVPPEETQISGIRATDPAFGLSALWVTEAERLRTEVAGYTVVDPTSVIATHMTEVIKRHASEILGRQEVQELLNRLAETHPAAVEGVVPNVLGLADVHKVLTNLLAEQVSVRDMLSIMETLGDRAPHIKDLDELTEAVRLGLRRRICAQYLTEDGRLPVLTLDPRIERIILSAVREDASGRYLALNPEQAKEILEEVAKGMERVSRLGYQPVLVCAPRLRLLMRRLTEPVFDNLVVLSQAEIVPDVTLENLGMVTLPGES